MIYLLPPDITQEELDYVYDEITHLYNDGVSSMVLIDKKYYRDIN